jgi:hypothetical protein
MFRLVLGHPETLQDRINRKCTAVYVSVYVFVFLYSLVQANDGLTRAETCSCTRFLKKVLDIYLVVFLYTNHNVANYKFSVSTTSCPAASRTDADRSVKLVLRAVKCSWIFPSTLNELCRIQLNRDLRPSAVFPSPVSICAHYISQQQHLFILINLQQLSDAAQQSRGLKMWALEL